jgi:hypothetical protein
MSLNTPATMDGPRYARFSRRLKTIVVSRNISLPRTAKDDVTMAAGFELAGKT